MLKKYGLYFLACTLILIYIFSFFLETFKGKEKYTNSVLINPSYKTQICTIRINDEFNQLMLENKGQFWKGSNSEEMDFPVNEEKIQQFFECFCKIRKIYSHSATASENNNFGLDKSSVKIEYALNSGETYSLIFGNHDFTGTRIFLTSDKIKDIVEVSSDVDFYLNTLNRFWADTRLVPFTFDNVKAENIDRIIFSENKKNSILAYKTEEDLLKINRLLDMRHGNLKEGTGTIAAELKIFLNDGQKIEMKFYETSEQDFIVKYNIPELKNYSAEVSAWTFNQIKAQFK